ncbi:hypothetical protein AB1Y20_007246 [Prymnesium parvum]|uniref:PsbP C-terminal domain-containing protein n=1 Tax=Prymnesium parvum TaxID=97485 RepID=A0AB34IWU1_PRYPA|mmetsp:Transcript_4663/g.11730  ORF Transcript_4663/g.11730 Transcript_4663/m.11730 type:complete len:244 (-) Transcript_4663:185-916(-)
MLVVLLAAAPASLESPRLLGRTPCVAPARVHLGYLHSARRRRILVDAAAAAAALHSIGARADETAVALPQYDEFGRMTDGKGYSEVTRFNTLQGDFGASVRMLASWVQQPDGSWKDPVLGSSASFVRMSSRPTSFTSTAELGRPERVELVPVLGLAEELKRADLVSAAIRKTQDAEYYDYDLALPARNCVPELATACLPEKVVLVSCAVCEGRLHVMEVAANPDEWRRSGKALRSLRSTFTVG